jgi:N-acetylmuramic acid 6-phosphate etherase
LSNEPLRDRRAELHLELASLTTEARNTNRPDLGTLPTLELVEAMNREDALVSETVGREAGLIALAVDALAERLRRGGRLLYIGAGTAGRLGVLDASECPPTFGTDPSLVVGIIAGGDRALREAVENSEDDEDAGVRDLEVYAIGPDDTVVGISASGRTPYVASALRHASERGALTIALSANRGSRIGQIAEIAIETVVGPEFVAGSTRLKAGTAQKLVLNMLSTIAMIRLGKTFNGAMVDLQATNEKLLTRSELMVREATGVPLDVAASTLAEAQGSVKVAILMLLAGIPADVARESVESAGGHLGAAVTARCPRNKL